MPLTITPSERSTKAWGVFAKWPLRLDIAILLTGFVTLLFSLSSGVWHVGSEWQRYRNDPAGFARTNTAARISLDVVVPIAAMGIACNNIWFYTTRVIAPAIAAGISIVGISLWIVMLVYWTPLVVHHGGLESLYAARVIAVIGALIEVLLYITYAVYASLAMYRLMKRSPLPARDTNLSTEQELESRRVSHAYVGSFPGAVASFGQAPAQNSNLAPPSDYQYPRRRSSVNPFADPKAPGVTAREF